MEKEKLPFERMEKETAAPREPTDKTHRTVLVALHPDGKTSDLLDLLSAHPQLHLTLFFPPGYFESEERQNLISDIRVLISSGQIEVGMTLDHKPNLALLGDIRLAKGAAEWNFDFARPEDIEAHVAGGSAAYQKRWNRLPSGVLPPYFALSDRVLQSLKRFRLNWVVAKPSTQTGVIFRGPVTILVPPPIPIMEQWPQGGESWATHMAEWCLSHPFSFIDASSWDNPRSELAFLSELARTVRDSPVALQTAKAWTDHVDSDMELKEPDPFQNDFSEWTRTVQQKRAWEAISEAREALEKYKNSGRANLNLLDSAMEEILTSEGGEFLLALGQTEVPLTVNKRNFIATLSNVYRLAGLSIPPRLPHLFSGGGEISRLSTSKTGIKTFFEEKSKNHYAWNDPKGDDFGGGTVAYPTGPYTPGDFDLRQFHVQWTDTHVTFTAQMETLANTTQAAVLPLIDVYIDINRIPNAGSTTPLRNRGPLAIHRDAAWEFALSFGPDIAVLYQSVIGNTAREVRRNVKPRINDRYHTVSVTFPRSAITNRNEPSDWRMTVAVGGSENSPAGQLTNPLPVLSSPGTKNFGGAATGRSAPIYIDVLAPSVAVQKTELKKYAAGRNGTLPYIEAQ